VFDLKRSQDWAQSCLCRLTFELSGPRRQGALAAKRMIGFHRLAAKVPCRRGSARAKG
jgi:hypothetical protein